MPKWICQVCGYAHEGPEAPASCPVCGATQSAFEKKEADIPEEKAAPAAKDAATRKWRCTVCGYVHEGSEPPETCPLCGAPKSAFEEIIEEKPSAPETGEKTTAPPETKPKKKSWKEGKNFKEKAILFVDDAVSRYHLHPISVHIPNGVLPIAVFFLILGLFLDSTPLKTAAFFNMCMVLLSLPLVIYAGLVVWRDRYRASLTPLFRMKLLCAAILAFCTLILVLWRAVDPGAGGAFYLFLHLVALGAAAFAGHLGSKLVFAGRSGE